MYLCTYQNTVMKLYETLPKIIGYRSSAGFTPTVVVLPSRDGRVASDAGGNPNRNWFPKCP